MRTSRASSRRWPVLLTLAAASCQALSEEYSESSDVERTPSFSAAALAQDGVVIAAIVSSDPERLAAEATPDGLAAALRVKLLHERPGMRVLCPGNLEEALGADAYQTVVGTVERTGGLAAEDLAEILRKLDGEARYLLVGRIERDRLSMTHYYARLRETTMTVAVYDAETASLAWKGRFKAARAGYSAPPPSSDSGDEDDLIKRNDDDKVIEALAKDMANDILDGDEEVEPPPPPEAVSIQAQVEWIYAELVESLLASKD